MTITPLLSPRLHALSARQRDLRALRRRIDAELGAIHEEIQSLRPAQPGGKRKVTRKPCGTEDGYQWHRRFGPRDEWPLPKDDPCGCRAAHREYERERRANKQRADRRGEVA